MAAPLTIAGVSDAAEQISDIYAGKYGIDRNDDWFLLKLQEELSSTENKISFARQAYNDAVMRFNNAIEQFPNNVLFSSFKQVEYFEVESAEERKAVKVSF